MTKTPTINVSSPMLTSVTKAALTMGNSKADLVATVLATGITSSNWEHRKDELAKVAEAAKVGFIASAIMKQQKLNDSDVAIKKAKAIRAKALKELTSSEKALRLNVGDKEWSRIMGACGFTALSGQVGRGNRTKGKAKDAIKAAAEATAAKAQAAETAKAIEAAKAEAEAAKAEAEKLKAEAVKATKPVKTALEMLERLKAEAAAMSTMLAMWKDVPQAKPIVEALMPHLRAINGFSLERQKTATPEPKAPAKGKRR